MRIKRKRFVFNPLRLFYFKEKPTTPLRHGGKTMKKLVSLKKLMKTKENWENIYKMLNAWQKNCRSILAFRGNKGYKEREIGKKMLGEQLSRF